MGINLNGISSLFISGTTQTLERATKDLTDTKTKLEAMNMDLKSKIKFQ